ncbi:protein-tyrosine-phosphatase [Alicyclobacillus contaminans]|uniref:low molecular weight protein arginine phosphatase n=1 Tax=Alicyclobacillus contaminans TaxID=392016 RepID=UPI0004023EDC|nr:low molecular weight protein arginine phosphatase [Alicyclobacillus contaminans]GMA50917.1 protein-tyrosine-phosphatase [Alicyclobacillus contaminans]
MHLLFVCTGNTCRSPMAAFLAQREVSERGLDWVIQSAGLYAMPGQPLSSLAADALTRRGVPLQAHQAQPVTAELVAWADAILVMTAAHEWDLLRRFPEAAGKTARLGRFLADAPPAAAVICDIVDPFGGADAEYEACADDLSKAVRGLIEHLATKGSLE